MMIAGDFMLGNRTLHDQLCLAAAVLGRLVSSAPRAVTLAKLEECTERSQRELKKLCGGLVRNGLLRQEKDGASWALACSPSTVTLEDVFRCVVAGRQERAKAPVNSGSQIRVESDVQLLVMQATMAVNQSVFKHLRQFSLDRLKSSSTGIFPTPATHFSHQY